jgi:hypothetical protein
MGKRFAKARLLPGNVGFTGWAKGGWKTSERVHAR